MFDIRKVKSHMEWSWVIIVTFFLLSIIDIRFGVFGFICMLAPITWALMGKGKIHCSHYCPRGSFFGKMLPYLSMKRNLPKFMGTKMFKHVLLILMLALFTFSLSHTGYNYYRIAFAVFRLMLSSFIVGAILGIIYKPRSWCKVCPMGHAAGLIKTWLD